jgi:hypothetical protein
MSEENLSQIFARITSPTRAEQFDMDRAGLACGLSALAYHPSDTYTADVKSKMPTLRSVAQVSNDGGNGYRCVGWEFADMVFVAIEGTSRTSQWVNYLTRAGTTRLEGTNVRFFTPFFEIAESCLSQFGNVTGSGKPLLICGHSAGGAAASILGYLLKREGYDVRAVYTFGSPKPGDHQFRRQNNVANFRILHAADPVPKTPPSFPFAAAGVSIPGFLPGFVHVGTEFVTAGGVAIPNFGAVLQSARAVNLGALTRVAGAHSIGNYLNWFRGNVKSNSILPALTTPLRWLDAIKRFFEPQDGAVSWDIREQWPLLPNETITSQINAVGPLFDTAPLENTFVAQLFTGERRHQVHLFVNEVSESSDVAMGTFTQPSFPGYAPFEILPKTSGGNGSDYVARFTLTADLLTPVEIVGAFQSFLDTGGRIAAAPAWWKLDTRPTLRKRGDSVQVSVNLRVAGVGDTSG